MPFRSKTEASLIYPILRLNVRLFDSGLHTDWPARYEASTFYRSRQRCSMSQSDAVLSSGRKLRLRTAADFRNELVPAKIPGPSSRRLLKLLASPTQTFSLQDTPSHIHNGLKTCCSCSPPNCQAIGSHTCSKAHLCVRSASWCYSCSQGGCYLTVPTDSWYQDNRLRWY